MKCLTKSVKFWLFFTKKRFSQNQTGTLFSSKINGRRIYGGCTPHFMNFFISDFILKDTKKIFCKCYQNYLRHLWLKSFIFQMSGRWFPWHPKGGCTPPINLEVFFSDILATASRLNTSYGLETLHVQ